MTTLGQCYPIRHAVGVGFGDSQVYCGRVLVWDLGDRSRELSRVRLGERGFPTLAAIDRLITYRELGPGAWVLWQTTALHAGAWVRVYPGCWVCAYVGMGFADDRSGGRDYRALQRLLKNPRFSGVNLSDSLPIRNPQRCAALGAD
jgi:hypothetical protein